MVTLFIFSFVLLAALAYVVYLWQRPASDDAANHYLQPAAPQFRSLFTNADSPEFAQANKREARAISGEQRAVYLTRAAQNDKESLRDAHALGDRDLYDEVLNRLLAQTRDSVDDMRALAAYIVEHQGLRGNRNLAEAFFRIWQNAPERASTARMLRVAALSDDAEMFRRAVETTIELRRRAQLSVSTEDLCALVESEYWLLAPEARSSGAGFVLKETIAELRRGSLQPTTRG